MRDKDANTAWAAASEATLEERRYYCQNWRADVVALLTAGGDVSEWVRYSAYGEATVYPFVNEDLDADGDVDDGDTIAFSAAWDSNANAADVDRGRWVAVGLGSTQREPGVGNRRRPARNPAAVLLAPRGPVIR